MTARQEQIPHADDLPHPLGRHIAHDEASKAFPAQLALAVLDVWHTPKMAILDQGNLGSCTGNAAVGVLGTEPRKIQTVELDEALAVSIYERATVLDGWDGSYPPDDTGSDGLSVCKAMVERGLISAYDHAFGLEQTLLALSLRPVMIGVPWFDSMWDTDSDGFLNLPAGARQVGGHEVVLDAIRLTSPRGPYVGGRQSWGLPWGYRGAGRFRMKLPALNELLSQGGDCTIPRY